MSAGVPSIADNKIVFNIVASKELEGVRDGSYLMELREIVHIGTEHIKKCTRCTACGYICEICKSDDVIYPYDLETTVSVRKQSQNFCSDPRRAASSHRYNYLSVGPVMCVMKTAGVPQNMNFIGGIFRKLYTKLAF